MKKTLLLIIGAIILLFALFVAIQGLDLKSKYKTEIKNKDNITVQYNKNNNSYIVSFKKHLILANGDNNILAVYFNRIFYANKYLEYKKQANSSGHVPLTLPEASIQLFLTSQNVKNNFFKPGDITYLVDDSFNKKNTILFTRESRLKKNKVFTIDNEAHYFINDKTAFYNHLTTKGFLQLRLAFTNSPNYTLTITPEMKEKFSQVMNYNIVERIEKDETYKPIVK